MSFLDTLKANFEKTASRKDTVFALYNALVLEARSPALYKDYAIPDTLDGRFDAIVLHIALFGLATSKTLEGEDELKDLGKDLVGVFLKDMDRNLREIGVGDLSVGKKVKKMASALYGRIDAYATALVQKDRRKALALALKRNLYRGEAVSNKTVDGLAGYSLEKFTRWQGLDVAAIRAAKIS